MKKTKGKFERYNRYGYLFLAPFFIAFLVFQLYPIIYTIFLSFTDLKGWNPVANFIGVENYTNIFGNAMFIKSIKNTFILWGVNFIPQIGLALLLAAWFTNIKLRLKNTSFFKVVFYLPNIITAASVAVLFYALFSYPMGPMNLVLTNLGVLEEPFDFFRSVMGTRLIVSFIQFWMWYGQTTIVLVSGILSIDNSLFESAMVDGANDNQIFRQITLPLLKPILLYTLVTSLIGGLQMFDIPFLLTNGNPGNSVTTITMFIYKQAFTGSRNFNVAATASVILLVLSIVLSTLLFRFFKENSKVRGK
ncbi:MULTISPECIES: carbohydrate ABC transporter permease [Enterococcus]|uniref:carbohydrate ABC transporter permease n=1 Tax=Enterococcus TaxID=1350 RepID=UPI0010F940CE|nr:MULTISPECIES: sugar ABC transporter permease [Enterococcus]KAF1303953.1 sugar ABC transporter permease [Enterococcus sp. JM9B]